MSTQILASLRANPTLLLRGQPGSGKSSVIPEMCMQFGNVICSQPRTIATTTIAEHVSDKLGCPVGTPIGYRTRFKSNFNGQTKVLYVTEQLLLNILKSDPLGTKYGCIILDEVHGRALVTDLLLERVKWAQFRRPKLKVVIMSATIGIDQMCKYFPTAQLIDVPGTLEEVKTIWPTVHQDSISDLIMDVVTNQPPGDILIFLDGQRSIEVTIAEVEQKCQDANITVKCLPIYSKLSNEDKMLIHEQFDCIKLIFSTDIAEEAITIDKLKYVVDSGVVKLLRFNHVTKSESLVVVPISKSQSIQRAGRAGRTKLNSKPKYFPIFTKEEFDEMLTDQIPQIQRLDLSTTVLTICLLDMNPLTYDYFESPKPEQIVAAMESLNSIQCLDEYGKITVMGRRIAALPVTHQMGRSLISSTFKGCSEDVTKIVSMLSSLPVMLPKAKQCEQYIDPKVEFIDPYGDPFVLLNIFNDFSKNRCPIHIDFLDGNCSYCSWCRCKNLNGMSMIHATKVFRQLTQRLTKLGLNIASSASRLDDIERSLLTSKLIRSTEHLA
jgi:HrpA-like RNA helicase